jgi:hypothetical protein
MRLGLHRPIPRNNEGIRRAKQDIRYNKGLAAAQLIAVQIRDALRRIFPLI